MPAHALNFSLYTHPRLKDPFDAASASRFMVYRQLVRSLIGVDAHGAISGDLARSWKITADYKIFTFELAEAKWSDGQPVSAADLVKTFQEGMKAPHSVHFNFSDVKRVSAPNPKTFEVEFKKSEPNALYRLSLPEAGLLYRNDFKHSDSRLFRVTPGAYSLGKSEDTRITLEANPHFKHQAKAPKEIHFDIQTYSPDNEFIPIRNADILLPLSRINEHYEKLAEQKVYRRVVSGFGWTNFFSLNAKNMKRVEDRQYLQDLLAPGFFDLSKNGSLLQEAKQIFMLNGPSFLQANWVKQFWNGLSKEKPEGFPKKLSIVGAPNSPVLPTVIERLEKQGIAVERIPYADFTKALSEQKYDLILINNDFSSADLLENLNVTFSGKYVNPASDSKVPDIMKAANAEPSLEKRFPLYREVGKSLLTEGLVIPFAYQMVRHFVSDRVSPVGLEEALLEFKLWEISMQDAPKK